MSPEISIRIQAQNLAQQGFQRLQQDLRNTNSAFGETQATVSRVNPTLAQMRREYTFLRDSVHNAAAVTRQLSTAFGNQLQSVIDSAVQFERLRRSLTTISDSAEEANEQYERLIEVSRLPGLNLSQALRASVQLQAIGQSGQEAADAITQFGNALALGGGSARDLNQLTNAIRQMSAEGKILQEDLSIMTTRLAVLVPILKDEFGGTRAQDIRDYFDSFNIPASEQANRFLEVVLERLRELPRAGDTAANAMENLADTAERTQAAIGTHLLPAVRDFTASAESMLMSLESAPPELQKVIAVGGVLGTTFITVTAATAGLTAALPALKGAMAFLVGGTNPVGLAITAIALLTAGIIAWNVATADATTAQSRLGEAIASQDFEGVVNSRTELLNRLTEAQSELTALEQLAISAVSQEGGVSRRERADTDVIALRLENVRDEIEGLEQAISVADVQIQSDLAGRRDLTPRGTVLRPTDEANQAPEQRATFALNVEGELSESDVANIESAVQSLAQLGENQEAPQVLRDLNDSMIGMVTVTQEQLIPGLHVASENISLLGQSANDVAIAIPQVSDAVNALSIDFQAGTRELRDLQVALEPLSSPAALAGVTSVAQTLGQLISGFQDRAVSGTGAADIGLPVIGAEADPNRDRFLGAFNLTALTEDIATEFDGYGRQFGEAVVAGLIDQGGNIQQVLSSFVSASFQDLAVTLGGSVGDQITGALSSRFSEAFAPVIASFGSLGAAGALGLGAGALSFGHILESAFGFFTPDDTAAQEERAAIIAEREAQGIFSSAAGIIDTSMIVVPPIISAGYRALGAEIDKNVTSYQGSQQAVDDLAALLIELGVAVEDTASQFMDLGSAVDAADAFFAALDIPHLDPEAIAASNAAELLAVGGTPDTPIRQDRSTFVSDTGELTEATQIGETPLFTGLSQGDLDLVSSNVAELLQGTLADQVITIMPQDGVMPVMLQQDLIRVKVEGGTLDEVKNTIKIQGDVNATQVGTFAVTQSGEWVMQLTGGGTIPVRVAGGRMTVDIGGGLESLAVSLADEEVSLRAGGGYLSIVLLSRYCLRLSPTIPDTDTLDFTFFWTNSAQNLHFLSAKSRCHDKILLTINIRCFHMLI